MGIYRAHLGKIFNECFCEDEIDEWNLHSLKTSNRKERNLDGDSVLKDWKIEKQVVRDREGEEAK